MTSKKRVRLAVAELDIDEPHASQQQQLSPTSSAAPRTHEPSSFRNVSACNRCRLRKNRCDQNLPACSACEKAGVKCVGFDPLTKREIPRTYVYYLESRINYLEALLSDRGIEYAPAEDFDLGSPVVNKDPGNAARKSEQQTGQSNSQERHGNEDLERKRGQYEHESLNNWVSNIGMVSVQGASDLRFLGSTSGISFARVVFQAVKNSKPNSLPERHGIKSDKKKNGSATPSMRESFFALQSKPAIKPAAFPDRHTGLRLAKLYFEHANPQIPILHREDFMSMFEQAYAHKDIRKSPKELYMLFIVFAIGAGIILEDLGSSESPTSSQENGAEIQNKSPAQKRRKTSDLSKQPEEYHASAMLHLEPFLGAMPSAEYREGSVNGLEQLQAVLLLAGFALLRPVAPGLWYITGVAVRLAVDLGLHHEEPAEVDVQQRRASQKEDERKAHVDPSLQGITPSSRRGWIRDLRRRLWWCTYSFDRLVSTCVGRPFGITDQAVTTEFPSLLDDIHISHDGLTASPESDTGPSYKRVSHHYFRLRLLQSEMLQVLQYRQAQKAHERKQAGVNQYMHTTLSSPFLQQFSSFHAWRRDIDRRLWEWKESAPSQADTGVQFSVQFLELNYWQAVIMLYRQTLSTPEDLAGEKSPTAEVASSWSQTVDEVEDEDDIYLKVAEAGQRVLKLYRQLHRVHLVNYTYLATVHLFMAGIAFLYAIWHSPMVRGRLTLDDVDFTVLAATSVLRDLVEKCPPAEACREAFDRMSKATIKMSLTTTGFGSDALKYVITPEDKHIYDTQTMVSLNPPPGPRSITNTVRPPPQFDMNLRALFSEETLDDAPTDGVSTQWTSPMKSSPSLQRPRQIHKVSPSYPLIPQPHHSTDTWNPVPAVAQQVDLSPHAQCEYAVDLDSLMSDDDGFGPYTTTEYDLNMDLNADAPYAQAPPLELFDNFFFGGSGITPS